MFHGWALRASAVNTIDARVSVVPVSARHQFSVAITLLVKVSDTPVIRGNVHPLSNPDNKDKQAANRDKHRRH